MIAILCTDGVIRVPDICNECQPNKWVPVLVYRRQGDPTPTVLVCDTEDMAKRFSKRNIQKGWLLGAVYLGDEGLAYIKEKGWKIETIDWPRKMTSLPGIELGYEVVDFATNPAVYTARL